MNDAASPALFTQLAAIRGELLKLSSREVAARFELQPGDALLKTTISLCPSCLVHVPAAVFTRDKRVLMRKTCAQHGTTQAVIENDDSYYHLSNKDCWGRCFAEHRVMDFPTSNSCCGGNSGCCGSEEKTGCCSAEEETGCCGAGDENDDSDLANFDDADITPQMENKSCTILVEITNACNLACVVCYSDSRGDRKLPVDAFKTHLQRLIEEKGPLDSVQVTGGEAILHPEFWDMLAFLHALPVKKIYLPTNGILFAREENARRLAPFKDKLMVLLQFDGREPETNRAIRNANPSAPRDQVIAHLAAQGIHMQLTMTLTLGVNDHEIGWVVETAMRHRHIKVVALQPVTYSGRYGMANDAMQRLTLSDCVKAIAAQIPKRVREDDFKPIPCSHPNCGWITLFVQRFGITRNIARHIDLEAAMETAANRTLLNSDQLRSIIGTRGSLLQRIGHWAGRKLVRSTDVFAVAIKPFMDRFNYDQDRVSACCHHLLDTEGRAVSFCEYNARIRPHDSWEKFPKLTRAES